MSSTSSGGTPKWLNVLGTLVTLIISIIGSVLLWQHNKASDNAAVRAERIANDEREEKNKWFNGLKQQLRDIERKIDDITARKNLNETEISITDDTYRRAELARLVDNETDSINTLKGRESIVQGQIDEYVNKQQ